ncbi:MAG: alpha/beta fold hydrolase, partial [Actinomycetales bacterium]
MRARLLLVLLAVVLVAGVVVAVVLTRGDDSSRAMPEPAPAPASAAPLKAFYEQKISWSDCDGDRCGWVKVPVDYEKPDGETLRLRVRWVDATSDSSKVVFVNPGGPGGSAVDFAGQMATSFGDGVRKAYNVVGVDPRGVGLSDPVTCLDDKAMDAYVASDPTPDDPAEVKEFEDATRTLGEGCVKRSGELASHVSTEEAARDMDVVRGVLGQKTFTWFGASYGTQLGATYATLFPQTVGRMVLDGAVDPDESTIESALGQATGFQRAFDAYAASCATKDDCPVGSDPEQATQKLSSLLEAIDRTPLRTGTSRVLTEGNAFYGIAVTLYSEESWPILTQALQAAVKGDGTVLLRLSDIYFDRDASGKYTSNQGQVISAVSCLDADDRPTFAEMEKQVPRFEKVSPLFGRALALGAGGCSLWPVEATNPQPTIDATGSAPIVVVGT